MVPTTLKRQTRDPGCERGIKVEARAVLLRSIALGARERRVNKPAHADAAGEPPVDRCLTRSGERKASEMSIVTRRGLQPSRAAIAGGPAMVPLTTSSRQRLNAC
jgi:hypothetical protein